MATRFRGKPLSAPLDGRMLKPSPRDLARLRRLHAQTCRLLVRFEEILAENLCGQPSMREVCELIGVSGRTLWSCCAEFLGMSPARYILLRRLKLVRNALRDADRGAVSAEEIVHRFGFVGLASFARGYYAAFGETPSATLRRNPDARFASR